MYETWIPEDNAVSDIIETYKKQFNRYLEQHNSLGIIFSSVLESELISKLSTLNQQLKDNIVQTGINKSAHHLVQILRR